MDEMDEMDDQLERGIEAMGLGREAERYLRERWADQLRWFEAKAARNQRQHRWLRMITIVGGVLLPVLINEATRNSALGWRGVAVGVGVIVGVAGATDVFLRPGERWLQFRDTAERLRREWWLFSELAGEYAVYPSVLAAHGRFVERVEGIIVGDVDGFVALARQSAKPVSQPEGTASP